MAQVLPLVCGGELAGSAVVVLQGKGQVYLATALHLLGSTPDIQVALTWRQAGVTLRQLYPVTEAPLTPAEVVATCPFCDLAILRFNGRTGTTPPLICPDKNLPAVGTEVVVLGYPFAPRGSVVETWTPGHVMARVKEQIVPGVMVDEVVLSVTARPGSSGSAVVGREDGVLYGILRGTLPPPQGMDIGKLPVALDATVTFATNAACLRPLIKFSREH